ncbi:N-acetylglucosamine kinase [Flavobacteriaceae bacterium LMO-SS05]
MILIADSGSTKCDWVILGEDKKVVLKTTTQGINPRLLSTLQINTIIEGAKELYAIKNHVTKILFYGAGCARTQSQLMLEKLLLDFFPLAKVIVKEDLSAAVSGTTSLPGVVCILGTGSNCCYFDGVNIHVNQASLGFLVMDEGSGNYFGKQLLKAYFYKKMPSELQKKFEERFDVSLDLVLKNLYEIENPSAYLANFASFLIQNRLEPFISKIIKRGIAELFDNLIACYTKELKNNPLHFVGSIAYFLQEDILLEAKKRRIKIESFVKRPMDNIIANIDSIL